MLYKIIRYRFALDSYHIYICSNNTNFVLYYICRNPPVTEERYREIRVRINREIQKEGRYS